MEKSENTKRLWLSRDDDSCGGELWLWPQEPIKRNGVWCVLGYPYPCGLKLDLTAVYFAYALKLDISSEKCIQFCEVKEDY